MWGKPQCNLQKAMAPPPGAACWTQATGLPDASLLTVLKPCTKKGYRILTCLLFISSLHEPQLCDPLDSLSGETQLLRHKPSVFPPLPAWGLKPSFYFPQKTFFFHKGINFLYFCYFLCCFKTVNRSFFWKEGNLVINADCRSGTAKAEKESIGQGVKNVFLFNCSISNSFKVSVVGNGHEETGFLHVLLLLPQ